MKPYVCRFDGWVCVVFAGSEASALTRAAEIYELEEGPVSHPSDAWTAFVSDYADVGIVGWR